MWDLPGPELEPVSPALAGGFLTTAPPGKSSFSIFGCVSFCFGTDNIRACLPTRGTLFGEMFLDRGEEMRSSAQM